MKRIKATDNGKVKDVLTLSAKDWAAIYDGGSFELVQGEDFDGSVGQAGDALYKVLLERFGVFRISRDVKNNVVRVKVTPPKG